jgi:hypothetical protein
VFIDVRCRSLNEEPVRGGWTGTDSCCWRGGYFRIGDS